ncbi:MAG: uroporphyrinogen-III synthase [Pseudomonadota bacterium]|jgi:uroporphyrinogen-III synthase
MTRRPRPAPLAGRTVVVTRPAGTGGALARAARALGAQAVLLPGAALRGAADPQAARAGLDRAARADAVVFTSPAAVRFAFALRPRWRPRRGAAVHAVGPATARALARRGVVARAPDRRYDSEGLLAALAAVPPRVAAVIGAPGGRGLIADGLRARGTRVDLVEVYRRVPARLDARHLRPLARAPGRLVLLLSSVETLGNLRTTLPADAWVLLRGAAVVASSARVADAALAAGLRASRVARSALGADLLAAAAR